MAYVYECQLWSDVIFGIFREIRRGYQCVLITRVFFWNCLIIDTGLFSRITSLRGLFGCYPRFRLPSRIINNIIVIFYHDLNEKTGVIVAGRKQIIRKYVHATRFYVYTAGDFSVEISRHRHLYNRLFSAERITEQNLVGWLAKNDFFQILVFYRLLSKNTWRWRQKILKSYTRNVSPLCHILYCVCVYSPCLYTDFVISGNSPDEAILGETRGTCDTYARLRLYIHNG